MDEKNIGVTSRFWFRAGLAARYFFWVLLSFFVILFYMAGSVAEFRYAGI